MLNRRVPWHVLLVCGVSAAACEGGPESPLSGELPSLLAISADFPYAASGDDGEAYDAANGVWIRLAVEGSTPAFEDLLPFDPTASETAVSVEVTVDRATTFLLEAELRRGPDPLFRGASEVLLGPGRTATATLDLQPVPAGLALPESVGPLASIGQTAVLEGFAVFATGDTARSLTLEWTSLDPDVAEVVVSGGTASVRAVGDGDARIRASLGGLTNMLTVQVRLTVQAVDVDPGSGTIPVGGTVQLTATATDALGNELPGRVASWSSDDPSVATVDEEGLVRGLRPGSVQVTAAIDGAEGSATVVVVPVAPSVLTAEAVDVGATGAGLRGVVNPRGSATTAWFEWAMNESLDGATTTEPVVVGSGSTDVGVSADVAGLDPGTPYYFRIVGMNEAGTSRGEVLSFSTAEPAPSALTLPAMGVTPTGATLPGVVNPNGSETTAWFEYSTNADLAGALSTDAVSVGAGSADVDVSADLTGLNPGARYYFRVVAMNAGGTDRGEIRSFDTTVSPPAVLTRPAEGITTTRATLAGDVDPNGSETTAWFEWATNAVLNGAVTTPAMSVGSGTAGVAVSADLDSLQSEATYYFRLAAVNAGGTTYGSVLDFRTALRAPSGLNLDPAGTSVYLNWQDNSGLESSFRIERSTVSSTSGFGLIGTVGPNTTSFVDLPPLPAGILYYRVRACDALGCSAPSNVAAAFMPAPVIRGTVIACSAACFPVPGMQVTLTGPSNRATTTAANGQYQFSNLPNGTYTVSVSDQPCDPAIDFNPNSRVVAVNGGGDEAVANFSGLYIVCSPAR